MEVPLQQIVNVMADLKAMTPAANQNILLIGKTTVGDGLGGFYRWDASSTADEDLTYLNVIMSTVTSSGRWLRIFQKVRMTAGGAKLVMNGGVKTLFVTGTTDANGQIVVPLTEDGTAGGTALFNTIDSIVVTPQTDAVGPADAVQSYRKNLAANNKTATYGFYKANALTLTLGLVYSPFASIGAGTIVKFTVQGS